MYGNEAAEIYDLLHRARGKDFEAEAALVTGLIEARAPGADSLLDVACGTGAHLRVFAKCYDHVEGVDLSPSMVDMARSRLPGVGLTVADMRTFELDRKFDAITCLFVAIAYLRTVEEIGEALRCFARHLAPGGVVVVEPWWFPESFLPGHVAGDVIAEDGRTIARVSHTAADSLVQVHYVVADASGARHFVEEHPYHVFTREQYEEAFASAGLRPEYVPGVQGGRGLFFGVATDQTVLQDQTGAA